MGVNREQVAESVAWDAMGSAAAADQIVFMDCAPGNWTLSCVKTITFSAPNRWFSVCDPIARARAKNYYVYTSWSSTTALEITQADLMLWENV
jgi:hypothetical protein